MDDDDDDDVKNKVNNNEKKRMKLLRLFSNVIDNWRIYIRQEVALIGFAMASIFLTVLGFSGVTAAYFLTQGLRNDLIGIFQGVGAVFGVAGTIIYPPLRQRFGTVRTGLFGISSQLIILLFCIVAIVIPTQNVSSRANGYYSPDCSAYVDYNVTTNISEMNEAECVLITMSSVSLDPIAPTQTYQQNFSTTTVTPILSPTNSTCNPTNPTKTNTVSVSVYLMLAGIVGCRAGLWLFDLAVQQLVQENVVEEERGVVSGVMNAMNSVMDMTHYLLVIAAPRPENFNILTAISYGMVVLGWLLYSAYVRKSRQHFFHFSSCPCKRHR